MVTSDKVVPLLGKLVDAAIKHGRTKDKTADLEARIMHEVNAYGAACYEKGLKDAKDKV